MNAVVEGDMKGRMQDGELYTHTGVHPRSDIIIRWGGASRAYCMDECGLVESYKCNNGVGSVKIKVLCFSFSPPFSSLHTCMHFKTQRPNNTSSQLCISQNTDILLSM